MHIPVLLKETIDGLDIKEGDIVVDATFGGGGHSREIIERFGKKVRLICIDRDQDAEKRAEDLHTTGQIEFVTGNFGEIDELLVKKNISVVDRIIADIGLSSFQIDDSKRGFTFQRNEELLMTMGTVRKDTLTAKTIVNTWDEETIANIIYAYGDERYSRGIAKAIVKAREKKEINTTDELVEIIFKSVPSKYRHGKIHPATRTFQALRITVNNELEELKNVLHKSIPLLNKGGRFAVISFHSLEDKIVKDIFRANEDEGVGIRINKKPIIASDDEIKSNPRSRSAKLRIFEKL